MAKILILDVIDSFWGVSAKRVVDEIKAVPEGEALDVVINSPGGSVFEGMAIYHALCGHKGERNVEIHGLAASMASVIAMAGTTIKIGEGGMVMVHDPLCSLFGNAEELRKEADVLDKIRDSIVNIYHRVTGKSKDDLKKMMAEETWLTADEAVAQGFAKEKINGSSEQNVATARFAAVAATFAKAPEAAQRLFAFKPVAPKEVPKPEAETKTQAQIIAEERKRVLDINALAFEGFEVTGFIDSGASVETVKAAAYPVLTAKLGEVKEKLTEAGKSGKVPAEVLALLTAVGGKVEVPDQTPVPVGKNEKFMALKGAERTKYWRENMAS